MNKEEKAVKLTKAQREFLLRLNERTPVSRSELPPADRDQDRVRQSCKRLGLAEFVGGYLREIGLERIPFGWRLTPAGRAALEAKEGEPR